MTSFADTAPYLFVVIQTLYFMTFLVDIYFYTRPTNFVLVEDQPKADDPDLPYIVLFYPVLKELEATMRTTFLCLARLNYPSHRYRVVAIPNVSDTATVASLRRLQSEFDFLQIVEVPPTSDPAWQVVWNGWDRTEKAYWWHRGRRARNRNLPPKKTRQLIYAFYRVAHEFDGKGDFLVNYIDADSCPPPDHFLAAAAGMKDYDVLQALNIAGNLNETLASSWHAFDHMAWDGCKYPHLSADGGHPYWVLGKGLFFKASDLLELGGFHPWITIEDPEVGMRFWTNGRRLGIIESPLIEEVPATFAHGVTQRKRWVAGFFQSLGTPLREMGMRPVDRVKAWLNFIPCLSLWLNAIGLPVGIWALAAFAAGNSPIPTILLPLGILNLGLFAVSLGRLYAITWQRTSYVLKRRRDRLWYMLRVNPLFLLVWWLIWLIPLWIGLRMYLRDEGLVWERTEKTDANGGLVRASEVWSGDAAPAALAVPAMLPPQKILSGAARVPAAVEGVHSNV
jgi:cellulose synthase/poly-beta-1,6-N-acetylglucosamine synthase-like glycosyltransferase